MSASPIFDVCAIGNALVDVVAQTSDDFLKEQGIPKGGMTLVDVDQSATLYNMIGPTIQMSGGSAANTIAGLASFGGAGAFMGKVKADQLGAVFRHDLHSQKVHFSTTSSPEDRRLVIQPVTTERRQGAPTGRCIILVTPDAQRSMSTYLGAAVEFGPDDVQPDVIRRSKITYLEGYLFDPPQAKQAFYLAARTAADAGCRLALTLSDVFCVERHRAEFLAFIREHVDILFSNHNELLALYETQDLQAAIEHVRKDCALAVTTRSEKGALITSGADTIQVDAATVDNVVDTTGAGDLFAAGFLYGLTHGRDLATAGRIGALAAAEIISHFGPRPQHKLSDLLAAV